MPCELPCEFSCELPCELPCEIFKYCFLFIFRFCPTIFSTFLATFCAAFFAITVYRPVGLLALAGGSRGWLSRVALAGGSREWLSRDSEQPVELIFKVFIHLLFLLRHLFAHQGFPGCDKLCVANIFISTYFEAFRVLLWKRITYLPPRGSPHRYPIPQVAGSLTEGGNPPSIMG